MKSTKNLAPKGKVLETPIEAWHHLCAHGGIESGIDQRDEPLTNALRVLIDANKDTLDEALSTATMETFVGAFFQLIQPFVSIFRDILAFFEEAGAKYGQGEWLLKVGDLDLDLEHFRKSVEDITSAGRVTLEIPAVDFQTVWEIDRILRSKSAVRNVTSEIIWSKDLDVDSLKLPRDVKDWLHAYMAGEYRELPASLKVGHCPSALEKPVAIANAAISVITELRTNLNKMKDALESHGKEDYDPSDVLAFWQLAHNETDRWLGKLVIAISAATQLTAMELESLGEQLEQSLSRLPTKKMNFNRSFTDLERVLSLPIWKKRYELYSVWVGTEIVRALTSGGHHLQFHHENGRIAFAFKETEIATVLSASRSGPVRLMSERRSKLDNPVGHHRMASVQPDFGIWTGTGEDSKCLMVIEVKHYLRSARQRFIDVLKDYSRAHSEAEVYLVNYGPIKPINDPTLQHRCHTIGQLSPSETEKKKELQNAVLNCVGEPIHRSPQNSAAPNKGTILAIDVSGSMSSLLRTEETKKFVQSLLAAEQPTKFAAIDTEVRGYRDADLNSFVAIAKEQGGSTDLKSPIRDLLCSYERVLVLTDVEALDYLAGIKSGTTCTKVEPPVGLFVHDCIRVNS